MNDARKNRRREPQIQSGREKPVNAFAAVRYREHWFWVENGDLQTKRALTIVMFIFALAESGGPGRLPLITISAQ